MCKQLMNAFSGKKQRVAEIAAQVQQEAANKALKDAVRPAADNEAAQQTGEARMRRLMALRGPGSTIAAGRGDAGTALINLRQLLGA